MTPQARALLRDARPEFSPSPAEAARLQARLFGGTPPDDPSGGDGGATAGGAASWPTYLVAAAVIVALVAWALPSDDARPGRDDTPIERPPARAAVQVDPPPAKAPPPAAAEPQVEPALAPIPEPDAERSGKRPRPAVRNAASPEELAPVEPPDDDLSAELALISEARRALNTEAWGKVQARVREHRERFPKGALREEAHVLDLLARCATAASAEHEATVREYLSRPRHMFDARLRRACLEGE
jgi:hypothetical protein